jgi:hypothetical protein
MPTTSIDTFFACVLMVIVILSAMAATSNLSYLLTGSDNPASVSAGNLELSRYILLNEGDPPNWGQESASIPTLFGLAKTSASEAYELDVDKLARCNSQSAFSLTYTQVYAMLKMPDFSFEIEVRPIFDVEITQTAEFVLVDQTIYQFKISTDKAGLPVDSILKAYAFAEAYFESSALISSTGEISINVTLPNSRQGSALLIVFASSVADQKIVSFASYIISGDLDALEANTSILALSCLNGTTVISSLNSNIVLSDVYAVTPDHNSTLQLAPTLDGAYIAGLPLLVDFGPMLVVATGYNNMSFFVEWTSYPQLPLRFGAEFENVSASSTVSANQYIVKVGSSFYICIIRVSRLD